MGEKSFQEFEAGMQEASTTWAKYSKPCGTGSVGGEKRYCVGSGKSQLESHSASPLWSWSEAVPSATEMLFEKQRLVCFGPW